MNNIVDLACQLEETCRFCYPPEKERILYATENFYVMASLGPIVEGYLLIVSKNIFRLVPIFQLNSYKNILT